MRASFEARRTERLSSGGGSREADSWSKSLRSRAPASTYTDGGGSQRRLGSSSSSASSPATPARASAAGRLTHSTSGGSSSTISSPAAPSSTGRASAAGKLTHSQRVVGG
ncbi:hypothetical protein OEZ86_001580 [Tetradesmus obliquus]|nr:hypothetical protein OEZ86_001580 [Tetradesmus obliquus]